MIYMVSCLGFLVWWLPVWRRLPQGAGVRGSNLTHIFLLMRRVLLVFTQCWIPTSGRSFWQCWGWISTQFKIIFRPTWSGPWPRGCLLWGWWDMARPSAQWRTNNRNSSQDMQLNSTWYPGINLLSLNISIIYCSNNWVYLYSRQHHEWKYIVFSSFHVMS